MLNLLQDCNLAIERDSKEFAAWFNKGNALARLQDYGGALESYRTAADLAPGIAGYRQFIFFPSSSAGSSPLFSEFFSPSFSLLSPPQKDCG